MKKEIKKVVFYGSSRTFRSSLIGNLYEIAQVYPVIFLSEDINKETEEILRDKKLFPKLEEIILFYPQAVPFKNIFQNNRHLYNLAKSVINRYKPNIVISESDFLPFDMYLMRFAKRIKAVTFSIPSGIGRDLNLIGKRADLENAYYRFPKFLPLRIRFFFIRCRRYIGHILYYWLLPLLVGERPFRGKSSFALYKGNAGMRDADYQIAFSKTDSDVYAETKVPLKKLYILSHPLERETKFFFQKHLLKSNNHKGNQKTATLLLPSDDIGFGSKDCSLISEEERFKTRIKIIRLVESILKGWKIFIKPHPDFKNFVERKKIFESIFDNIEIVNPLDSVDKYIGMSDVVIGMPIAISTVLFYASLTSPEKAIISLDFDKEMGGDYYKDFDGIEYIDNEDKFAEMLALIAADKYKKADNHKENANERKFADTIEMLNYLYNI
ncbi:MAG: hypothetical protein AAB451_02875 [Patescibacteria group bacterium]